MAESARARSAFEAYYAMGPARSFDKLVAAYAAKGEKLSRDSVKFWGKQNRWQARIAELSNVVAQKVESAMIEREVSERIDALTIVNSLLSSCERAIQEFQKKTEAGNGTLKIESIQDLRQVSQAVTELAKTKNLLEGGATERLDTMSFEQLEHHFAVLLRQAEQEGVHLPALRLVN